MVTLKEITAENFWDCIALRVSDAQADFVTPNAVSIAQAKVQPECIPLAVYSDDTLVGFAMYCIDGGRRRVLDLSYDGRREIPVPRVRHAGAGAPA